jgi:hypothetical protein
VRKSSRGPVRCSPGFAFECETNQLQGAQSTEADDHPRPGGGHPVPPPAFGRPDAPADPRAVQPGQRCAPSEKRLPSSAAPPLPGLPEPTRPRAPPRGPRGDRIFFVTNRDGLADLWAVDVDPKTGAKSTARQLTSGHNFREFTVAPDGRLRQCGYACQGSQLRRSEPVGPTSAGPLAPI